MMLQYLTAVLLGAAAVFGLYMLGCAFAAKFGRRELMRSGMLSEEDDAIHIYANAESLEYYIRCALMSSNLEEIRIVIHIRKNDADRDEMIDITERFSKTHKNLTYRLV